jgi:hypothetical protein
MVMVGVFFSASSLANIVTGAKDNTPECLKKVDWPNDSFRNVDDSTKIYVKAQAFGKLTECATAQIDFERGMSLPQSDRGNEDDAVLSKMDQLIKKYPNLEDLIRSAVQFRGSQPKDTDLVIGDATEKSATAFVRANYYEGVALQTPIATIISGGISYVRSPEYPGFCDDLKKSTNAADYQWCTGAISTHEQDPRLFACTDQYCTSRLR